MKSNTRLGFLGALVVLGLGLALGEGQIKQGLSTQEFMREKLEHAQLVLKGLAVEDFELIIARSKKLSAMSQQATWEVFENPDYAQQSVIFRRSVDAMAKAAEAKNLDGATLAYVRMTLNCVECHKLVRGKLVARLN